MGYKFTSREVEDKIALSVKNILFYLGQDMQDENLKGTPLRVAKYLMEFINYDPGAVDTTFESIQTDQMVIVKDIPFWSLCSHHLLAFRGNISVGYLTGSKVIGLSKVARIVQKHSHKFQLQEKLGNEIVDELEGILDDSPGLGILIRAQHSCMQMRGIKSDGWMITSVLRGQFRDDPNLKSEFLMLAKE